MKVCQQNNDTEERDMNVSSIVIKTSSDHVQGVIDHFGSSGIGEVHFHDAQGRIVVTIEGKSIDDEMDKLKQIQGMPNVVSASLAYAYSEQELRDAKRHIALSTKPVPDALAE
jgi:nitrate reductase NapAB chaperone NapD